MSTTARNDLLEKFRLSDDPVVRARQREIAEKMLELNPDLLDAPRCAWVRSMLRRVLSRRRLELSIEEQARIEACSDLDTLRRWVEEAVTAASAAEALR